MRPESKINSMFIMSLKKKISDFNANEDEKTLKTIR